MTVDAAAAAIEELADRELERGALLGALTVLGLVVLADLILPWLQRGGASQADSSLKETVGSSSNWNRPNIF